MDSIASKIALSPSEAKIICLLTVGKETDTKELTKRFYKTTIPHNGQVSVANVVRSLARKTERNSPYVVRRGKREGPYPMTVVLEKRS